MASIVDRPKASNQDDLLKIEKYTNGLIRFIESSETPITIGVQGEWGSGKTSLLNTIQKDLETNHYSIWINTWEYSLLSTPDETLIKIISGLVVQISELTKEKPSEQGKKAIKAVGTVLKEFGGFFGGAAGQIAEKAGEALQSSMEKKNDNSIKALRDALEQVIKVTLDDNRDKRAFIFFIDDLDRLDPTVAVTILELIKNLFDLDKCIFVLAIDYGVVVKGLQSKFGKMTDENEWEFRAFFDKIIQLPFSMPTGSYNIGNYLQNILVDVGYFEKSDLDNEGKLKNITDIVGWSVGTNPRALKRLTNSVSLIEIIRGDKTIEPEERVIEFALICIQIAYPVIYGLIQKDSDFTSWSEQFIAEVFKNKNIDDTELMKHTAEVQFNEPWEQNIWRLCQINSFLRQRTYQLSNILNFIKDEVSKIDEDDISEILNKLLSMSSVTSVSAENITNVSKVKEKTKGRPKELLKFQKTMEEFIENECNEKYSKYLETEYISSIKLQPSINSGKVFLNIKWNKLDFTLYLETDYTKIHIYINNSNSQDKSLTKLKKLFDINMRAAFPDMSFKSKKTKSKIITLVNIKLEANRPRQDVLNDYKNQIVLVLDKFLPKISEQD